MSVIVATIEDVVSIARREALNSGGYILGVTASEPEYVTVGESPNEVNEFVVDVLLLENASQAVVLGGANNGLRMIENVLIASEASGGLLANQNTPVQIEVRGASRLTVTGRAKVAIPTIALDEYDLFDLRIQHTSELTYDGNVWRDPFGFECNIKTGLTTASNSFNMSVSSTTENRLSTLGELGDGGGFGTNKLQRQVYLVSMSTSGIASEEISINEEITGEVS